MPTSVYDLLRSHASEAVKTASSWTMPAGHNGPYADPETPVRNTGHWLMIFAKMYEWTGEPVYRAKVKELADYLCSSEARPGRFAFHHRKGPKDHCNGLIGQAWTMEALATASYALEDPRYAALAEKVFFQHPFDEEMGLWHRLEVDGRVLSCDGTFNHQLWFAACASILQTENRHEVMRRIHVFIDRLRQNLTVLPDGLIYHPIEHLMVKRSREQLRRKRRLRPSIRRWLSAIKRGRLREAFLHEPTIRAQRRLQEEHRSVGYHSFNTYAFAILHGQTTSHSFWRTPRFQQTIDYLRSDAYSDTVDENKYAYGYNPTGFEVPFTLFVLGNYSRDDMLPLFTAWMSRQIERCHNPMTLQMDRNTDDRVTLTARMYELVRLPRALLESIHVTVGRTESPDVQRVPAGVGV